MKTTEELSALLAAVNNKLKYDPETGHFTWIKSSGRAKAGARAGSRHSEGYREMQINNTRIFEHRLAMLISTGVWPEEDIDHINGNRSDNRICNLRAATRSENNMNAKMHRNNSSGIKGVSWSDQRQKWVAQIVKHGKHHQLGRFESKEAAAAAYAAASARLHGEFGRVA